ncbi:MAG: DUF4276 family protein [Deltaproteobacteria bacterium]|nr:DUF4276 family protein [Deltaproteobacteria bacterium]
MHTKSLFPGCPPLKPRNLGGIGSHLSPQAIAKRSVRTIIGLKSAGCSKVVFCLDREQRSECVGGFATSVLAALHNELAALNQPTDGIHVVVADRAFEAWILADAHGLYNRGVLPIKPNFTRFEGQIGERQEKGTREISKLLQRDYSKTRDGPQLFEQINFKEARKFKPPHHGSRSLDKFLRTLGI